MHTAIKARMPAIFFMEGKMLALAGCNKMPFTLARNINKLLSNCYQVLNSNSEFGNKAGGNREMKNREMRKWAARC